MQFLYPDTYRTIGNGYKYPAPVYSVLVSCHGIDAVLNPGSEGRWRRE